MTRRYQHANDAAKRDAAIELIVRVLDHGQVGKRKERVGVVAEYRPNDAALDEVPQVILAQQAVPRKQIALSVKLALQRFRRGDADDPAEIGLAQNLDVITGLTIQVFRTFELVTLLDPSGS